ncbi:hypothetical protein [Thalassobacillus sp. CUG 92003]|uniref:hypothetical protein n=1 Tax=Thalassobacillus sp. CUG 92003 TaxID=2736641 RepID=UPI0015E7E363|nr:hypothetical protein [Thalassobacillus sp. CUG 92003]
MREFIWFLVDVMNLFHDKFIALSDQLGLGLNDKALHFLVIGVMGIVGFLCVNMVFHAIARISITAIAFIFSLTLVILFVFAVEIQQGITNNGNMDFTDAAVSIYGFLAFFGLYLLIRGVMFALGWVWKRYVKS